MDIPGLDIKLINEWVSDWQNVALTEAADNEVLVAAAKKVLMCFDGEEEFNIPGYIIEDLRKAVARSEGETKEPGKDAENEDN